MVSYDRQVRVWRTVHALIIRRIKLKQMKNFHNCRFSAIKLTVTVCLFAAFFISNDIKAEVLYQDIQDPSEIGVKGLTGINTIQEDKTESQNKGYTRRL